MWYRRCWFNFYRKKIVNKVFQLDKSFKWESIVSKDCVLNGNVNIGDGSLIMSGVTINTQTIIGKHCFINTSSSIGFKNNFMDFSVVVRSGYRRKCYHW